MSKNNALVKVAKSNGWDLLPDNDQYENRIQIYGSTGNPYVVAQRKANGQWSCGCRGWIRHRHCTHLDKMMPTLALLGGPTVKKAIE